MIYFKLSCTKFIDIFKMNKIIVSIALTIIIVIGINKITDMIFHVEKPEKSAYQVTNQSSTESSESQESSKKDSGDIMVLFASASAADGEKVF